jgi:hypothetical protein
MACGHKPLTRNYFSTNNRHIILRQVNYVAGRQSCAASVFFLVLGISAFPLTFSHAGEDDSAALAKKLSNPVASIISVPFQFNYDQNIGPSEDGEKLTMNLQPVIPFSLNDSWNLISRTILPFNWQDEIVPGENSDIGIGDITQSLFFTPMHSDPIWAVGPVFLIPTATDELMGGEKWGAGPTGIILKQVPYGKNHISFGMLANHIWDFAGEDDRADVSRTFFQPFIACTTPTAWTYNLNLEGAYDWEENEASIPLDVSASKVLKIGGQPVSLQAGLGYWIDSPDESGPEGLRFRTGITFIFK